MSLLEETKSLLRRHRIEPKKPFGQNFMIESQVFQKMANHAQLSCDDIVLDIGAGLGFLTRFLSEKCKTVLAVELDPRLAHVLREQLGCIPNVKIIEGNILKVNVPVFNKVVSIPPYQISSRLLVWLFKKDNFGSAVMIFQKEFADRLTAAIGSEDYGWLTVFTYYHAQVELLDKIPKSKFHPHPKIDSIITCLKPKKPKPHLNNEVSFQRLLQALFTRRNRTVRNAALTYLKQERSTTKQDVAKIADSLPLGDKRVRELAPEDFGALANAILK